MAKSNSDVARALFNRPVHARTKVAATTVLGSNFSVEFRDSSLQVCGFEQTAAVFSYRTCVAWLVHNHNVLDPDTGAPKAELWVTRDRYSPTTDRHMSELRSAARSFNSFNASLPEHCKVPTYSLRFTNGLVHRLDPSHLDEAIAKAVALRNRIDAPGLHEHTRVSCLVDAIARLDMAIARVQTDAPKTVHATFARLPDLLDTALSMRDQLESMRGMPVAEMRVTARAIAALEKH